MYMYLFFFWGGDVHVQANKHNTESLALEMKRAILVNALEVLAIYSNTSRTYFSVLCAYDNILYGTTLPCWYSQPSAAIIKDFDAHMLHEIK